MRSMPEPPASPWADIWGNEDPVRYAAAIAKLIHEDCSVDAALKEMNRLYGKRG